MVSNEHPELLERLMPDPALEPKVKAGIKLLRGAETMSVTSRAGSDLTIEVREAGDLNLTFKRLVESPITLTIENDFIVDIACEGLDAELMASYISAWGDR